MAKRRLRPSSVPVDADAGDPIADHQASYAVNGLDRRVGFMLRLAEAAVMRDFALGLAAFDIRPSQFAALVAIDAEPGLKQQEIGRILAVRHPNLVALIDGLEARGLLERTRARDDRRSNALRLTAPGRTLLKNLRRVELEHQARLVERLGDDGLAACLEGLTRLSHLGQAGG